MKRQKIISCWVAISHHFVPGLVSGIVNEGAGVGPMPWIDAIWDLPDDPQGNGQHIAEHGITPIDVEHVLNKPDRCGTSRSGGRPMLFGRTPSGERIAVVYEEVDESSVYPVSAYIVED